MYKGLLIATALTLAAANSTSAWAGWGCAYNSSAGVGRNWNADSEKEARDDAMHNCTVRNFAQCRIIGCRANVNSKEDADKYWPRTPGIKYERCEHEGDSGCR
jgi:hypothetical protein